MECNEDIDDIKSLEDLMDVYFQEDSYPASKYWLASMVPPPNIGHNANVDVRNRYNKVARLSGCGGDVPSSCEPLKEPSVLPPCRICGEMASGFHYGANTCEACKGFFRRSLRRTSIYRCNNDGKCEISSTTRGQCSCCRYKKCISMGMSKEAIKTGRYTHEKKSKDLQEVRQLMQNKFFPSISTSSSAPPPSSSSSSSVSSSTPSVSSSSESSERLIQIIQSISRTHLYYSKRCVPDIQEREEEHMISHDFEKKVFGSLKTIPLEEYLNIYHSTGIDIDGRKEMVEGFVPLVEYNIRKQMAVAKTVPGFNSLPVDDQIQVIKSSRFEVWMILHHKQFNPGRKLFTTIHGKVLCCEDMVKLHNEEYIEVLMKLQGRIKSLQLDYEETCLLAGLTMMFNDRCRLSNPSVVDSMQDLLLKCLIFWMDFKSPHQVKGGSEGTPRFWRMVDVIIQLRTVRHLHDYEEEKLIRLWFDKVHISPLIYEMWAM